MLAFIKVKDYQINYIICTQRMRGYAIWLFCHDLRSTHFFFHIISSAFYFPRAMPENSFLDGASRYVTAHKIAVTATSLAVIAAGGATAYYVYNAKNNQPPVRPPGSKKAKKSKKKNKKKANSPSPGTESSASSSASDPLPEISESALASWSPAEKEKVAIKYKEQGNIDFNRKNFDKAIEYYTQALKCKEDAIFYSNRSACYNGLQKYDKVIEDTTKALQLKPDYVKCLIRRANAHEKLEQYESTLRDLTAASVYGGFNDQTLNADMDRVLKQHSQKIVDELYVNHEHQLPSVYAIISFFRAFRKRPIPEVILAIEDESNGDFYLKKGLIALEQETLEGYEEADAAFEKAVELNNGSYLASAYENRATMRFLKGDVSNASEDFDKAVAIGPTAKTYILRATLHADRNNVVAAKMDFEQALKLQPDNPDIFYHRAQVLYMTGDLDVATENYEKSIALDDTFMFDQIQKACIAYRQGKASVADEQLREVAAKFPDSPEVPNYYGEILTDQSKFDEAIAQFDKSIELQAKSKRKDGLGIVATVNKATLIAHQKQDFQTGETLLEESLERDPKSDIALLTLAQTKLTLGKIKDAISLFERAAKLARTKDEMINAVQYAEAAKTQIRLQEDEFLQERLRAMLTAPGRY